MISNDVQQSINAIKLTADQILFLQQKIETKNGIQSHDFPEFSNLRLSELFERIRNAPSKAEQFMNDELLTLSERLGKQCKQFAILKKKID